MLIQFDTAEEAIAFAVRNGKLAILISYKKFQYPLSDVSLIQYMYMYMYRLVV